jgi:predicted PurR-regulated permease PerM
MAQWQIPDTGLQRLAYALGVMMVIALGFYTFGLVKNALALMLEVLNPFFAAFLMAYLLAPVVIALQRHLGLGRILGTLVLYLMIFLAAFFLLAVLIPVVLTESLALFNALKAGFPVLLEKLSKTSLLNIDADLVRMTIEKIKNVQIDYEKILSVVLPGIKQVATGGLQAVGVATRGLFTGVGSVLRVVSFFVFMGIINFYLILDWEKIRPVFRSLVPARYRQRSFDILEKIDLAVGGFLRGQLTVSAIVGSLFAVGLFAMGFIGFPALRNYCVLIGTAAAIGGFVPYLGSVMGVTPAMLIVLLTPDVAWRVKLGTLAAVLALFALIQATEGFILQPKIVGKGAGLHPLAVMFALLLGARFGIAGMIVAVPAASIIRVLIREFIWLPIQNRDNPEAGSQLAPTPHTKSQEPAAVDSKPA